MQSVWNERVLQFQNLVAKRLNALVCVAMGFDVPEWLGFAKIEFRSLCLNQAREFCTVGGVSCLSAPAIDRRFKIIQAFVQTCLGDRRRQITDEGRARPPFGNCAFGRIVRCVEIDIGEIVNQTVRPAGSGHPALFAWHKLQRTVSSKMKDRARLEIFSQIAIEGRESVRWGQALLEQQTHRIAFVAEGRLDANQHVAKLLT